MMPVGSGTGVNDWLVITFMFDPAPNEIVIICDSEYGAAKGENISETVSELELELAYASGPLLSVAAGVVQKTSLPPVNVKLLDWSTQLSKLTDPAPVVEVVERLLA